MRSLTFPFVGTDSVKENGELVSRLEEHASSDAVGDEKPRMHASAQLDVPGEGIHRVLVQDGSHVSVQEGIPVTTAASEEVTTKVSRRLPFGSLLDVQGRVDVEELTNTFVLGRLLS